MVVIGMVMTGLIFFQVYWIKSSVKIKEEQFNQLVNRTLSDVALKIQRQEAVLLVMNQINPAYVGSDLYDLDEDYPFDTIFSNENSWLRFRHELNVLEDEENSVDRTNNQQNTEKNEPDSGLVADKQNRNLPEPRKIRDQFIQKEILVNSIIENMFRYSPRIENRVNLPDLQQTIKSMFIERGIQLDFEFSVTKWSTMIAFKSAGFKNNEHNEYYKVRLFPDDFYTESNYLIVYFPDRKQTVLKSLGFMAISSISLTIILFISIALAIYIIFRQKRLSDIRNDFISNMTHELKTPISTISLASQMLGDESIPENSKNTDYLSGVITDESKKLGYQVEKVLQLAIFEKGKLELKFRLSDLHEIIMNVISTFNIQIRHRNGLIHAKLNSEKSMMNLDSVHITNVFSNLIDNAIKYCSRNPEITIETVDENGYIAVSVVDNGIGMNKQDLKKIFEKFYRIPTGNIHTVKGFGLGLSYVKKIVEEHKGYIRVESKPFEGTVFRIYLPLNNIQTQND